MATRARRTLSDHKKFVHVARLRKIAKETANLLFIEQHGFSYMRHTQEILLGTSNSVWDDKPMQSVDVDSIDRDSVEDGAQLVET